MDFAVGASLLAAILLGVLWLREQSRLRETARQREATLRSRDELAATLATSPFAVFHWDAGQTRETVLGALPAAGPNARPQSYAEFAAGLAPADAARLAAAFDELRRGSARLSLTVAAQNGASYAVEGSGTASGAAVLWIADASSAQRTESARAAAVNAAATLREMFDAIPVAMWQRGPDLALVDCNVTYATALDMPREAVLAESRELASADKARELARRALRDGAQSQRRHVVIAGSRRLVDVTEMPDRTGGTIGFAVDRTDVETAEAELSRHINAHGEVLESIHAAVAIYGADKRLGFFNSAFAALWGLEADWLRSKPSLDEVLERLRERRRIPELADFRAFKRQQSQMFTSLIEPQQELMHLPDDRTLSLAIAPHPFGGLTFIYEDVTDRLALERNFVTLTEVQRETLDNLFEGIAVYGSDGRLKLHNPAYRTIWALSQSDVAGEPHISEIVEKTRAFYDDGGDWPALKEQIIAKVTASVLASGPLDRRDGSVLQLATVPLPDGNVLLTCLDVTDTARVERALRERNEALETAGRLKSEFIANVSYELRTPLNAVIGFAEILANQYYGALTPRQLEYSHGILDSSHRLMSLINDILDLATIEAGYMELETRAVDVCDMMQGVLTLTRERARNQGLDLNLDCPADIGTIEADERRLKQALFNLVSNAIKFTPAGGSIGIEARRADGELVLAVSDTGIGIPEADQVRVFDKFERGSAQNEHSGAGLGLSLVKSLIELHGGRVEIASQPGQGTTIRCRLPVAPNSVPRRAVVEPSAAHSAA
jgi:signal transduction histidine kinase